MVNKQIACKGMKILSMIRDNSRQRLKDISRTTGIPVSTVYEKLRSYDKKYIDKYTCLLNYNNIGFNTRANILLRVKKQEKEDIAEFLHNCANINSVFKVTNGFDFMIEAIFRNILDMEDFMEQLDEKFNVKSKQIHYVIEDIKREGFLTSPNSLKILTL